jgi:hypothetical protein
MFYILAPVDRGGSQCPAISTHFPGYIQRGSNSLIPRVPSVDHLADVVADRLLALAGN